MKKEEVKKQHILIKKEKIKSKKKLKLKDFYKWMSCHSVKFSILINHHGYKI